MTEQVSVLKNERLYLLLPIIILIIFVFVYPIVSMLIMSVFDTSFGSAMDNYIGFDNFYSVFKDEAFISSILKSIIWTFLNLIIQLVIPSIIAILLNKNLYGVNAVRALSLLPWVIPTVPVAVCMRWMLLPKIGIVSKMVYDLGLTDRQMHFLGSPVSAMISLIVLNSWKFIPFGTLMILAALQTIPLQVYEAAKVDGTGAWQQFRYITLPFIGKMMWFVAFLSFAWNFTSFDMIWLTTQGGPGIATQTLPVLIYRVAFKTFRLGEASAISVVLSVILIIIGVVFFKRFKAKD